MDCLCRNLSHSFAKTVGLMSVYKMLGGILAYDIIESLDKGLVEKEGVLAE